MEQQQLSKEEAMKALHVSLDTAIKNCIANFVSKEVLNAVNYNLEEEKRMKVAVDNAVYSLSYFDVGKLEDIKKVIDQFGKTTRWGECGQYHKQVEGYVNQFKNTADKSQVFVKSFIEDFRVFLRSIQMGHELVGTAGTHHEKNARFRGLVELMQNAIDKLERIEVDYVFSTHRYESIFKSEYPIRDTIRKNRILSSTNKALVKELKKRGATDGEINNLTSVW